MEKNGIIDFDILQQIATLQWASTGDSKLAAELTTVKLVGQLYERLCGHSETDAIRNETIMRISKYVKDNPKASKEQLSKEIGKEIEAFAKRIKNM